MKPGLPTPPLEALWTLPQERIVAVLSAAGLEDADYLHWEKLRQLEPPSGLAPLEWWLALKWRRNAAAMPLPLLTAINGQPLRVTRHARVDAALSRLDRQLTGFQSLPDSLANEASRDRYLVSSLMEEAIHSSLFEGAVSTREAAKDLLRSDRPPASRDERMIVNNYRAMTLLRDIRGEALRVETVLELHRIMTEGTLDDPTAAGRIQTPDEPPPAEMLPERLERLVAFANGPDDEGGGYVHPILRAILLHFQLAYDHPFADGNGRTARALFYWCLLNRGYWMAEFLSISRLLYRGRAPYERAYQHVETDNQDGTYFVLQQLDVLGRAVDELFAHVDRKRQQQRQLERRLRNDPGLNHRQLAVLNHALRTPDAHYTHESHANSHRVSIMTARADLQNLVERGWLKQRRSGKRFIYVPAPGLDARLND
jgi:Fic family protein